MHLGTVVWRNLSRRGLSTTLTASSVALGVAVVVAVLALHARGREAFRQSAFGCDLVVGGKGSAVQLVLNSLFHLDRSPGNLAWDRYRELAAHRGVAWAVPIAVGDSYRGFRVVGTTDRFFADFRPRPDRPFEIEGRVFRFDPARLERTMAGEAADGPFEAVVGASAARRAGLGLGARFQVAHGVEGEGEEHGETWTVVGVLRPTGTPHDRAIFINLDSFYATEGHEARPEISAALVKAKSEGTAYQLEHDLNRRPDVVAAAPGRVVGELLELVGKVDVLLLAVAALVVVVAAVSILVSLYASMAERRRSIAILRALGAPRAAIFRLMILESVTLCVLGGAGGILLGHLLSAAAGRALAAWAGVEMAAFGLLPEELGVLGGVLVLGVLAGMLPAWAAYRMEVTEGLSPTS
jgi:putative ABC transport system permease protein